MHVNYKSSKIKQYYKNGRALRTELTINNTYDFGVPKALRSFECLRDLGKKANGRLLDAQCTSNRCQIDQGAFQEVVLPTRRDGQNIPGLRFGDPRVMALLAALCGFFHLPGGFRNRSLRQRVTQLLGQPEDYSIGKMTYDKPVNSRQLVVGRSCELQTVDCQLGGCSVTDENLFKNFAASPLGTRATRSGLSPRAGLADCG